MKRVFKGLSAVCVMFLIISLFAVSAFAQVEDYPEAGEEYDPEADAVIRTPEPRAVTEEYGTSSFVHTWVHASEFRQHGVQGPYQQLHYYWFKTGGDNFFYAPLKLPSGVDVNLIEFWYYDNNPTNNMSCRLYEVDSSTRAVTEIGSVLSSQKTDPHYGTGLFSPNFIFDNWNQYYLRVWIPVDDSTLRFKGVRIRYRRTISPPPSSATFSDVPVGATFRREIEALAAAGITTGYPDGRYGINDFITRGQMAAFLARALGLHHIDDFQW